MSQTDSFIEEVTEEVRRDRLFALLKRWGWVAGLAVLLLVGGAAYNEWRKTNESAQAQAFGDALLSGVMANDDGTALAQVTTDNATQAAIALNLTAGAALEQGAQDRAVRELEDAKALIEAPEIYRDLSSFKFALALPQETPASERMTAFEALTNPGNPFRLLAQEQIALIMVEIGQIEQAIALLNTILQSNELTTGLQRRASELIVSLGGVLEQGIRQG